MDKPLDITDMNNMLNQMMTNREKEFDQIQPLATKEATKEAPKEAPKEATKEASKEAHIKSSHNGDCVDYMWSQMAEETNRSAAAAAAKKIVSFEDENFISKLKKIDPIIDTESKVAEDKTDLIITELRLCIANQKQILNQLESLHYLLSQ
jgi:hypothetical protein